MSIAVLSPCLLEVRGEHEQLHYSRLSTLIMNLYSYTKLKFQYYRKAPFDGYKMIIPDYKKNLYLNNLVTINIYGTIQKMLLQDYIDLDNVEPVAFPKQLSIGNDDMSKAFCSYLNYLHGKESVLFIGKDSFSVSRPIEFNPEEPFKMDTSTYITIELTDVLLPYLKDVENVASIFPRAKFCSKYNEYVLAQVQQKGISQAEKMSLFEEIGSIVAKYNLYVRDRRLSKLNSTKNKLRIVYQKITGTKYYLSLDLESGGYEAFDSHYRHLGQFNFSCEQVKKPSPTDHILHH